MKASSASTTHPTPPPPTTTPRNKEKKTLFPFPLGREESFQGPPRLSGVIFHLAFFEARGNLKGRRYSSLVSVPSPNWGRFRCGAALRPPGILGFVPPGSHRVCRPGLKLQKLFFFFSSPFLFFFVLSLFTTRRHPSLPADVAFPRCSAAVAGYIFQPLQPPFLKRSPDALPPPITPPPTRVTTLISLPHSARKSRLSRAVTTQSQVDSP